MVIDLSKQISIFPKMLIYLFKILYCPVQQQIPFHVRSMCRKPLEQISVFQEGPQNTHWIKDASVTKAS